MIHNHDRSRWFGASDTAIIMGSWGTKTFAKWWLVKLGLMKNDYQSKAMIVGSTLEHRILDEIGIEKRDRQIKIWRYRLRVNLDGEDAQEITEVKTYSGDFFKVSKAYWQQCQAEMYATGKKCRIAAYRVNDEDYQNMFLPIDPERISFHPIERDDDWIKNQYLPRLRYLARCLRLRRFPRNADAAN